MEADMFCLLFFGKDHVEGYLELSAKTKAYFATAVALWDADFYVKVDDDVHVNIGNMQMYIYIEAYGVFYSFFFLINHPSGRTLLKDLKTKTTRSLDILFESIF